MNRLKFLKYLIKGSPIYFPGLDFSTREERNQAVKKLFEQLKCPVHYVLGNHELKSKHGIDAINDYQDYKSWFVAFETNYYYSWDKGGFHFIALDSNENYSPVLTEIFSPKFITGGCFTFSDEQLHWLCEDLAQTDKPTVIFTHIPLDNKSVSSYDIVNNAKQVRRIIHDSGKVMAVIQAHSHHMSAPSLEGYTVKFKTLPYVYLPSFGSRVVGARYSLVTINPQQQKLQIHTHKVDKNWRRRRKVQLPEHVLDMPRRQPITFSVINDIHYGPQRWDLYDQPEIDQLLTQFVADTNTQESAFVVVNGDWIDGHM